MAKQIFTKENIKRFEETASHYDNETDMLVALKAIKISNDQMFVIQYLGLKGRKDPVSGAEFTTDFPFALYRELIEELYKKEKKKKYAEKMSLEHFEATALTLTEDNF